MIVRNKRKLIIELLGESKRRVSASLVLILKCYNFIGWIKVFFKLSTIEFVCGSNSDIIKQNLLPMKQRTNLFIQCSPFFPVDHFVVFNVKL